MLLLHSGGMSLRVKRTCPVCQAKFDPIVEWQVCDTRKCTNVLGVRRFRARKRSGGGDDGGGRQRRLFAKPVLVKAKPPKSAPVAEPTLFETDLLATFGGAAEYLGDGFVSDNSRYSVKPSGELRKPAASVPDLQPTRSAA
jgi:hypothetical protein